jgi:hypothetical protein
MTAGTATDSGGVTNEKTVIGDDAAVEPEIPGSTPERRLPREIINERVLDCMVERRREEAISVDLKF